MMKNKFLRVYKKISAFLLAMIFLIPGISFAQYQEGIPKPSGPIDFSETSNQIIFIIIPVVILILYLIFRRRIKKIREERRKNK